MMKFERAAGIELSEIHLVYPCEQVFLSRVVSVSLRISITFLTHHS